MDDELRLEAGKLVLFRRSGLWQARIALGNRKYLWKSLKTSNTTEAKRLGLKLFHQTEYKLGEGLPVQTRSFSDVIDEYIAEREADNKLGKEAKRGSSIKHTSDSMLRQINRVSKFWKEYAGKGIGVRVLASLAGHKSIATTQAYIDVNDAMKRAAVELVG